MTWQICGTLKVLDVRHGNRRLTDDGDRLSSPCVGCAIDFDIIDNGFVSWLQIVTAGLTGSKLGLRRALNLTKDLGWKLEIFPTVCTIDESAAGMLRSVEGP
jgi:hypothetical protein